MSSESPRLTMTELARCQDALLGHVVVKGQGVDDVRAAVVDVLAALYEQRFGAAEGSTAYQHSTKWAATRYFDQEFDCLRWIIFKGVGSADVHAERVDKLPGIGWKISGRPWQELIYP